MITMILKKDMRNMDILDKVVPHNANMSTRDAAESLRDDLRSHWSPNSPSTPGESPAIKTGHLDSSIVVESQSRNLLGQFAGGEGSIHVVRIEAGYAKDLEHGTTKMLPRPFVLPAVMRMYEGFTSFFKDVVSLKMK